MFRVVSNNVEKSDEDIRVERAEGELDRLYSVNTLRAYRSDFKIFVDYCKQNNEAYFPTSTETVVSYLIAQYATAMARLKADSDDKLNYRTIARRLSAIQAYHRAADLPCPVSGSERVKRELKAIAVKMKRKPEKKSPLTSNLVVDVIETIKGDSLFDFRDRAVLSFGMMLATRRSELVNLKLKDIRFDETAGFAFVNISHSKVDKTGEGETVAVPEGKTVRPLYHLKRWLREANIVDDDEYIFRKINKNGLSMRDEPLLPQAIATIVKKRVSESNIKINGKRLDARQFSGHSLRSGFATSAARSNASVYKIAQVTRHKDFQSLNEYILDNELTKSHAASDFA